MIVPVLCAVCGYVSGTRSSLAYVAPLNLLVAPAFFVADADEVIAVMVVLSVLATIGLWAGSALRGARRAGPERTVAPRRPAVRGQRPAPDSDLERAGRGRARAGGDRRGGRVEPNTLRLAIDEVTGKQLPVDGRSNLTGNAASLTYTRGPGLHEFVTDEDWGAGPNDGARWELRSSFTRGYN